MEQGAAEGQVAVAGGGGEEGFVFAQGDEQQARQGPCMAVQTGGIWVRASSEKVQELADINLGLPRQTSKRSNLDRLVERNDAPPAAAPHHHMAAALANGFEAQALQRTDDLPSGKVRSLGMRRNAEHRHQGMALDDSGKLLEIERGGFAQVGKGLLDGFPLRCGARLRVEGHVPAFLRGGKHCSEFHRPGFNGLSLTGAGDGCCFRQTANAITGSHIDGICRSSRQRIAMALPFVAFIRGKPQANKWLGDRALPAPCY